MMCGSFAVSPRCLRDLGELAFNGDGVVVADAALSLQDQAEETAATSKFFSNLLLTPDAGYARSEPSTSLGRGHEQMTSTPGSPKSTRTDTGVHRGDSEDSEPMGEGEKLKQLLAVKRYEQVDLAKALGVTKNAVGKWTKEQRFSDRVWPKIRDGLIKLGLNPGDIRTSPQDQEASEDLTRLVERWSRDQLTVVRRIITSDEVSKSRLLAYIDGALRPYI